MSRKNKFTKEAVTDPKRIADLARQYRENDEIEIAEMVEVATQVRVRKKGDRIIGIDVPRDAASESLAASFKARRASRKEAPITDPARIANLARQLREHGEIEMAKIVEVATEVRIVWKGDRVDHIEIPTNDRVLNRIVSSRGSRH